MTTYVEYINARIRARTGDAERLIAYGQNITAGSHLSGLTRELSVGPRGLILNTPNIENTLVGIGFGVMLRGMTAVFFCKQQDFLLLGMDQIVNTYNAIRHRAGLGSFTIVSIIVDSGFEGPQSGAHNLSDLCSISQVPGYLIAGKHDADLIIARHLICPGFRFIGVSQRLFRGPAAIWDQRDPLSDPDGNIFCYSDGADATIVVFNLALPQAIAVWREIRAAGCSAALFSVNNVWMPDWTSILNSVEQTTRLVVIDDGKSANRQSDRFLSDVLSRSPLRALVKLQRQFSVDALRPNSDQFEVDPPAVVRALGLHAGISGSMPPSDGHHALRSGRVSAHARK
jgi:pyruvate/2-oxoglutarate/acetoin dehydrogenase E1 component